MSPSRYRQGDRFALHILIIAISVVALLAPFSAKAFHVDDPMYIWAARHIISHPVDFYGFTVNWEGYETAMAEVMKNPPGVSYLIAVGASLLGWGEVQLHIFFLLQAFAVAVGTYVLARRLTQYPLYAALAMMATPVFVLTGTSIMSDMLMLALYVWAVVLWVGGIERRSHLMLASAGILVALSFLTKYPALSLFPLLAAYAIVKRAPLRLWLAWFIPPIIILAGYHWLTLELYDRSLIFDAVSYSTNTMANLGLGPLEKGLIGLFFAGGCFILLFFYAPVLLSKRGIAAFIAFFAAIAILLYSMGSFFGLVFVSGTDVRWLLIAQGALMASTGALLLALTVSDLISKKDPEAILLFLWITGTFVFSSFVNWCTNGRTMLPIAPALGIILMRRLDLKSAGHVKRLLPLIPAAFIALVVTYADYSLAMSARKAGMDLVERYRDTSLNAVWFQGHWGFQHYVLEGGGRTLDWQNTMLEPGDIVVIANNNADHEVLPMGSFDLVERVEYDVFPYASTISAPDRANFYSSFGRPFPYAFGSGYKEVYVVVRSKGYLPLSVILENL